MNVDFSDLFAAIALVFVLEGMMFFLRPDSMQKMFLLASKMDQTMLRLAGFINMLVGLILLYLVR